MMKALIFILAILFMGRLEAGTSFVNGHIHALGGYPTVGMGIRNQQSWNGFDLSMSCLPASSSPIFHGRALYLLHINGGGFYLGGGLGCLNEPECLGFSGSLESAIGYQWKTKQGRRMYFQCEAFAPMRKPKVDIVRIWPGLTYGIEF
jgi:hypothetical protein